jgi:FtsP/CotA-like multicopper oxidase with cupredoxin domain
MIPHREFGPNGRSDQVGEEEERHGLLNQDDREEEEQSEGFSYIEELDWEDETKTPHPEPRRKSSWLRTLVVCLLVAWTLGFIVHSLLVPNHKDEAPETPVVARLRPEEDYILNPNWDVNAKPTTREYDWTIAEHDLNPDGVYRPMILINSMFPGPLVECNEGDEIVVHVHNRASNATSIHWHGLFQNGTNWMDGTVGVTQCPIAPGHDFTYRFRVKGQSGTYWYHSHMSVQASDGLVGPFIIHSKDEKKMQKVPYGEDRVVLVSDHYYDLSSSLLMEYLAPDRENSEPVPSAAVINGRGTRECSSLPDRKCDSTNTSNALFDLASDHNTRLRIINVGAFAEFQMQIDEHEFLLTEVDGTDVWPQSIHRLNINPAQRYSIILSPPNENKGLYWMRARMVTHCFAYENPELQEEVLGVIRYWAPGETTTPQSLDWPEIIEVQCRDLNTSALVPVDAVRAPDKADDLIYLRSSFQIGDWRLSRGFLNDSSYRVPASSPSLQRAAEGYSSKNATFTSSLDTIPYGINSAAFDPKRELVYQTTGHRVLDVLIQNFDDGNHPFHLHGYKFFVLASGHGYPAHNLTEMVDLENPLRRDTVSVEAFGWTLIRFVADNAGTWSFHCHISWHAEAGLLMQFLTRADEVAKWTLPEDVRGLCGKEGIEKGMGPEDERWVGNWGD